MPSSAPSIRRDPVAWTAVGFAYLLWRTRLFRAAPPVLTGPLDVDREQRPGE